MFPTLFLSHSTPLLALDSPIAADYVQLAQQLPRPEAILIMSAHWETDALTIGETCQHQQLIYDFYGFPAELYQRRYPAPAAEGLLQALQQQLANSLVIAQRGLDHGVWVPLYRMYPQADIPVLQISLPRELDNLALYRLGQALRPLREQGVLIIGSGMLTHNLALLRRPSVDAKQLVVQFDNWVKQVLLNADEDALLNWQHAPAALFNHPTPEHFRPLLFAAGAGGLDQVSHVMEGFEFEFFSRRSIVFGEVKC